MISAPDVYPSKAVVLVPMTSQSPDKRIDPSCLLNPGDHPCCKHPSFIDYRYAETFLLSELEKALQSGTATRKGVASSGLLARLRQGAESTVHLKQRIHTLLWEQGIVKPF
ncbi:MAG: hypothetical protein RBU21_06295 [FCB group bacterium]|nr:hypothetical protein [FCB group bacterium]